nr:hypothetical protein [uncultured Halomonas sp.]
MSYEHLGYFQLLATTITYPIALIDTEQNIAAAAIREWLASEESLNIFTDVRL